MKSNKRMQALLSTAMCAAILFSNAAAVFAAEVPPLPRKEGENPLAEQSPVNLLRQPGAASSYQYGEDALYNMSNLDLLGSDVSSLDLDCQKLTDGVKSSAGSIDFDSVVNFYSNSAFNNAENGAKFSNQNTVDFDLGQPKTIVEVNAYSSAGLTGRYAGAQCVAEEKARRVRERYDLSGYRAIHAYGDTHEDHALLALADHATWRGAPWHRPAPA